LNHSAPKPRRPLEFLIWGGLALTIAGIVVAYTMSQLAQKRRDPLPVVTQALPPFALTNQLGQRVTPADLFNRICVVDVIFTRCAGPCPEMTRRMSELQKVIPANLPVKLITVTTDPEYDTPEILKRYAERHQANTNRWWFLTGSKSEIARLAREGLKLVAQETKPEERVNDADLFIHSTVFVVLDKRGRLRGAFESTEPDFNRRILGAVRRLAREK
jgi:protein SCO1/2